MDYLKSTWEKKSLYRDDRTSVTVKELIEKLQTLPQEQEIVIYPKYDYVNGYMCHRFAIENIQEQCEMVYDEGQILGYYDYCAIIF